VYGARPLRRTIQKKIVQPLAILLLRGEYSPGDTVAVDVSPGGELVFERVATALAQQAA
jgi:ATP-dependent Clp protease ATP-binding subunit ClpB